MRGSGLVTAARNESTLSGTLPAKAPTNRDRET